MSILLLQCSFTPAQNLLREYFNDAMAAKENVQYPDYLASILKADSLRSNHQIIQYYVGSAYALTGDYANSIKYLRKSVVSKGDIDLLAPDFDEMRDTQEFRDLIGLQEGIIGEVNTSELAFTLPEDDFHAEGLAYDPAGQRFFVSSIHKKLILEVNDHTKETKVFSDSTDGLWSVFGLAVDTVRNVLWAASTSSKYMIDYDSTLAGKSAIVKYNLDDGSSQSLFLNDDLFHWFGDLTLDSQGNLYISDSETNSIYVVWVDGDKIEIFFRKEGIRSLQGLAISSDDQYLFYSDYSNSINRINLSDKNSIELTTDLDISLKSVDGLYYYQNTLVVTQNLVVPMRVSQLMLSDDGTRITDILYLEKNNPVLNEPTLGVIKDNLFYYVANSQWGAYARDGSIDETKLEEIQILKAPIKANR